MRTSLIAVFAVFGSALALYECPDNEDQFFKQQCCSDLTFAGCTNPVRKGNDLKDLFAACYEMQHPIPACCHVTPGGVREKCVLAEKQKTELEKGVDNLLNS